MFFDITEEVEALFQDIPANGSGLFIFRDGRPRLAAGFHTFCLKPRVRSVASKKSNSRATLARRDEKIRVAILAGERPKKKAGARGRPPTTWLRIAKELGVSLEGLCC